MSEKPGHGYLPPTVPTPGVPLRHQRPPPQTIYNSAPQEWQPPPNKPYLTALSGSASPQSEGLDLTSNASVGGSQITPTVVLAPSGGIDPVAHNGDQVVNGEVINNVTTETKDDSAQDSSPSKECVTAPSPVLSDQPMEKIVPADIDGKSRSENAIKDALQSKDVIQNLTNKNSETTFSMSSQDVIEDHQSNVTQEATANSKENPSDSQAPVDEPDPTWDDKKPKVSPLTEHNSSETFEKPSKVTGLAGSDPVESLLENMFEASKGIDETKKSAFTAVKEEPVSSVMTVNKLSVIVTNVKSPALSEDKVVAILEDTPVEEKSEVKIEPSSDSNKEMDKKPDIMEVESELEKMFAGIVEPGSNDSKQEGGETTVDGQPKKKRRRVSRGKGRKSTDSSDHPVASPGGVKRGRKSKQSMIDDKVKSGKGAAKGKEERRGPYVRVVGPRDQPLRVTVVNSGSRLDDSEDRGDRGGKDKNALRRKRLTLVEGRIQAGSGLYSSTLSAKYNSHSTDASWVCVFCHLGPHTEKGLGGEPAGDLFGPYIVHVSKDSSANDPRAPTDKDVASEQKKRGGGKQLSLRAAGVADQFIKDMNKKSRKPSTTEDQPPAVPINGEQEIWVHEKCAIWAPGVLLVNLHLIGLADAISAASSTKCSHCGTFGASVGCAMRNCPGRCHYGCAVISSWYLDVSKFIAACSNHAKQVSLS